MSDCVLAIDAGTTTVRALVFTGAFDLLGRAALRVPVEHPVAGRVEQDVERVWRATAQVVDAALADARVHRSDLAAIGVAAQRGNVVVWDRASGAPLAPLVSWQDLRGVARAAELVERGFLVSHQTAAAKLETVLAAIPAGVQRFNAGELLWGNIDTYLAWRLSDGAIHAMDHGHACATGYYDYFSGVWNLPLIELQGLDPARFPTLADTAVVHGDTGAAFGVRIPIAALLPDQQSALIAEGCLRPGLAKVTYGTSATLDANTGSELKLGAGIYPMVVTAHAGARTFCIEGMVNTAGAMIDWVTAELGMADSAEQLGRLAGSVPDAAGAWVLPALQGVGAPHGDVNRRAAIGGLSRSTTRAHVARAIFEGIAFRLREIHDAIRALGDVPLHDALRADGGASRSDALMQIQADVLGVAVERLAIAEASALGAAVCAAAAVRSTTPAWLDTARKVDRTFEPVMGDEERDARFAQWRACCGLAT